MTSSSVISPEGSSKYSQTSEFIESTTLRKQCACSELFWTAFSRIRTESGEIRRYGVSLRIQSECGRILTRITPNTDTFHAVQYKHKTTSLAKYEENSQGKSLCSNNCKTLIHSFIQKNILVRRRKRATVKANKSQYRVLE